MKGSLETLIQMFKQMNSDGWDTNSSMKWGFYFLDPDKSKLNMIYDELKDENYILEELSLKDDEKWQMVVSKIDSLTPDKLYKRNMAFNELADHFEVEAYDGWDVERIS
ncbi:MAG: ribonuclease E inhibitor RraB [Chitinophagaceae bacterium]|nr:ribonuclease E inhibitor RraB [Chitinophagaceae bacterium]